MATTVTEISLEPPAKSVTVHVAAALLEVHRETVYRWIRCGHLAYVQRGKREKRIPESEIQRLLRARRAVA